jgi:ankyrin repeat protein
MINTRSLRQEQGNLLPVDWVIARTKNLSEADNTGATPLHIAASYGELYSKKLLDAGADPAVLSVPSTLPLVVDKVTLLACS